MRNHELYAHNVKSGAFGTLNTRLRRVAREKLYDAGRGMLPCLGAVTTVIYNPRTGKVDKHCLSLARHVAQLFWGADSVGHVGDL